MAMSEVRIVHDGKMVISYTHVDARVTFARLVSAMIRYPNALVDHIIGTNGQSCFVVETDEHI